MPSINMSSHSSVASDSVIKYEIPTTEESKFDQQLTFNDANRFTIDRPNNNQSEMDEDDTALKTDMIDEFEAEES